MAGSHEQELTYHFDHPVRRVWPLVSHTELGNLLAGRSPVVYEEVPQTHGPTRRYGTQKMGGMVTVRYEELPYEWSYGRHYRVHRVMDGGPLEWLHSDVRVEPDTEGDWDQGGCTVHFRFAYEPRNLVGRLFAPFVARREARRMAGTYAAWAEALATGKDTDAILGAPHDIETAPGGARPASDDERVRIRRAVAAAKERIGSPHLDRLAAVLTDADPMQLFHMRPYHYAHLWEADRREVLDLFLSGVESGLLVMRWDILCPHCRGDRANIERLDSVGETAYCAACDLHFDVDLSRSVEAVFAPHPGLRTVEHSRFCVGGPGANAHVYFQHLATSGEVHEDVLRLPEGRYRLRISGSDAFRWVDVQPGAAETTADVVVAKDSLAIDDLVLPADTDVPLRLANEDPHPVLVTLETTEWIQDALSAGELVAMQRFRDVFSSEALAPGVKLAVERTTILFTDVVGSTAMYRRIGDARAFRLVWTHFDGLKEVIAEEGGALVKTIGDAVMAVFPRAEAALRAAARFQSEVDAHVAALGGVDRIRLKIGLADGPCIAVNLNGRLDYFGTTVNLAARVQARSRGEDILVARETADRAGAGSLLGAEGWACEAEEVEAKGFDGPVPVLRFTRSPEARRARG